MIPNFWIQYPSLTFDEGKHEYRWKDKIVPSATTFPDCIGYRKNDKEKFRPLGCPDEAKNKGDSDKGKALHIIGNAIVSCKKIKFKDPDKEKEAEPIFNKFYYFFDKYKSNPMYDLNGHLIAEYPMYSITSGFAGTPDYICRNKDTGIIWIIDWKSSGTYLKSYPWQTAAYEILFREVFGGVIFDKREKIIRATVLFSPDKDIPEVIQRDNCPEDAIAFRSIFNTYKLAA